MHSLFSIKLQYNILFIMSSSLVDTHKSHFRNRSTNN